MSADTNTNPNQHSADATHTAADAPADAGDDRHARRAAADTTETPDTTGTPDSPDTPDTTTGLFNRVLVIADGEATGDAAVTAGIDLAATHGASVDALYVVDTTEAWDMVVERHEREGEAAVEAAKACGDERGVAVKKWFRYGTAHQEVRGFAEAHDVDCIVVGSPRHTGLARLVNPNPLPTRLQRDSSVPVLVVGTDE